MRRSFLRRGSLRLSACLPVARYGGTIDETKAYLDLHCDVGQMGGAQMNWRERIEIDPEILVGKPVVKGTRLAVEFVIDLLAQGWTEAEILRNYPGLTREDIQACLGYAGTVLKVEKVYTFAMTEA